MGLSSDGKDRVRSRLELRQRVTSTVYMDPSRLEEDEGNGATIEGR